MHCLQECHADLFPIVYEDAFFTKAVQNLDGMFSLAAFEMLPDGGTKMIAVIISRVCDEQDDEAEDVLAWEAWGAPRALCYILTLGAPRPGQICVRCISLDDMLPPQPQECWSLIAERVSPQG